MHRPKSGPSGGELNGRGDSGPRSAGGIHLTRNELEFLRREIEKTDSRIVELVAHRRHIALEIGLVKQRDGVRLRDKMREREVKASFARRAKEAGADPALAVKLAELLISDSINVQRTKVKKDLLGKRALVIGGSGRIGTWCCRRLANRGAEVTVWDPRGSAEGYRKTAGLNPAARDADIVVIASPLGKAPNELRAVIKTRPKGLVFDVCSVKSHIAGQLRKAAASGLKVASVHPMFGPSAPSPKGRTVIICDCGSREGTRLAEKLFSAASANVVRLPLEKHDELMAYVLGLPHLTSLVFAATVAGSGRSMESLTRAQGPSFERMASIARELSKESVRVYHDIQALNPSTKAMFQKFDNSVKFLKDASMQKDSDKFRKVMETSRRYLEVR